MRKRFENFELARFLSFRDKKACEQVRKIRKKDICRHKNKNFKIRIIENETDFLFSYILDLVNGIRKSLEEGRRYVIILPATNPYYALAAKMINEMNISCKHVWTFNMDEYADEDGNTAPRSWKGGFQHFMWRDFFNKIDPKLRMPEKQINFPDTKNVGHYTRMIEDLGGADVCYGGIGWCGHIAFFESHLGKPFVGNIKGYLEQGSRIVELHPITVMQNVLFPDAGSSGDWSWCPPKAATIGPKDLKNSKVVKFWDSLRFGDAVWQRFITRLAAHGPVTPLVPASILQIINSELILSGPVADDIVCRDETID